MEKWEYKIEEYTTTLTAIKIKGGLLSVGVKQMLAFQRFDNKNPLTTEEVETNFNDLGNNCWELCEILPLSSGKPFVGGGVERLYLIFKRQKAG